MILNVFLQFVVPEYRNALVNVSKANGYFVINLNADIDFVFLALCCVYN